MSYRACDPCNCTGKHSLAGGPANMLRTKKMFTWIGAVSGAIALGLAMYVKRQDLLAKDVDFCQLDDDSDLPVVVADPKKREAFNFANSQHKYHSLALMAVPYASNKPIITGSLLASGIILFCGEEYIRAFKKDSEGNRAMLWLGGLTLLGAWLTFLL